MNKLLKITTILSLLATAALSEADSPTTQVPAVAPATSDTSVGQTQQSQLNVVSAVARPSMSGSNNSAAYITLHNNGTTDVTILGATALPVANNTELHSTADDNGVKKMVKVDKLVVPAGGDLTMQKGGIHIMLMDLKSSLAIGDKFRLQLITQELGIQEIEVQVVQM